MSSATENAMEATYQPQKVEHWYEHWERLGCFAPRGDGEPYCIMLPPPNVTGSLHMGHGFQQTLMDILVRYHRMCGRRTLWQGGTDHAGIATQMVVERQLEAQGLSRKELGREEFLHRVWEWKNQSGGTIGAQMRRLGVSIDWSRECFTMDEGMSRAVREVFIRLFDAGLIYRGKRLVNWDPVLQTAVSDLEVQAAEEDGHLWSLRYPLCEGDGWLTVATTRPETLLGDTAVAVHPADERYRDQIGRRVELPLCGRTIPVIADEGVDREFGSGCLKITPGHSFQDAEIGERHGLPVINVFDARAHVNEHGPEAYRGMERFQAREQIVRDLEAAGLLAHVEKHRLKIPRGDRSGEVLEPWLTDQWFVRTQKLAPAAVEAVESGHLRFIPDNWKNTYFAWLHEVQDWCISRQLWWGHRVPAWYDETGRAYAGHDEDDVRRRYQLDPDLPLRQDEDVLDTWFSSALWPFSTLGWPEQTEELQLYHPGSVLVTGFDIIFFWVARMVMSSLHFLDETPFHEVYVTGLVRDARGQKMSKSKGNVLDPIDLIDGIGLDALVEKRTADMMQPQQARHIARSTRREFPDGIPAHGADALRFCYCALATTTRDIRFDMQRVAGYRNFCNKLWNAARFVINQCADAPANGAQPGLAERWIVSRLQHTIGSWRDALERYRFDLAAQALYEFVWHEYCDWYLELCKPLLGDDTVAPARAQTARHTLVSVLEQVLRLAHPVMPFITEEIWQRLKPLGGMRGETIMLEAFPAPRPELRDAEAEEELEWLKAAVNAVRNIRGEMNIPPTRKLPLLLRNADTGRLRRHESALCRLAGVQDVRLLEAGQTPPPAATQLAGEMELLVPMADLIDRDAELQRLDRKIEGLRRETGRNEQKLRNPEFRQRAPAQVVRKAQEQLAADSAALQKLQAQRSEVAALPAQKS